MSHIKTNIQKAAAWLVQRIGVRTVAFEVTKACKHARTCRGGCRAASESCGHIAPFVELCKNEAAEQCVISG